MRNFNFFHKQEKWIISLKEKNLFRNKIIIDEFYGQ